MTRGQRSVHAVVWLGLAPLLLLAVIYAVWTRGYPDQAPPPGSAAAEAASRESAPQERRSR